MGSEVKCDFCHTGEESESICGTLHKNSYEGKMIAAHHKCMQYSAMLVQYKTDDFGGFRKKEVVREIKRGSRLACHLCKVGKNRKKNETKGATSGCALASCRKSFHYYCVSMNSKTVAKRYKVSARNKEVILYRVFCSKLHEQLYRDNISSEDIEGQGQSSDDENEENDDKQEESSNSSSNSDDEFRPAGSKRSGTPTEKNDPKRLRSRASDEVDETPSNVYGMSSPEMTANEVVLEAQRQYQQLVQKQRARERASSSKTEDTNGRNGVEVGISIDTDYENVTEDLNTSNDASADNTDLSETEIMLNSTQQGQYILIPSKLDVVDLKTVCKEAKLSPESVLLWPSSERGLQDKYMPFVMWDIANKIREGNQASLVRLLSDPASFYYEPFCSFLSGSETDINDDLEQTVDEVNIKYTTKVFRFLKISNDKVNFSVLVLKIPLELLNGCDLVTNFAVCQWTAKTVLSFSSDRITDFPLEKRLLCSWLTRQLGKKYELFVYPKEDTLKYNIRVQSVGRSLVTRLKSTSQSLFADCPVKVLVIYEIDRAVIKFKPYVQNLVESFVSRHPGFECFCVIDILPEDEIREIGDIVSPGLSELNVQVYSSVCPTYHQVSCVVVHIDRDVRYAGQRGTRAESQRSKMQSVYLDVDGEEALS